MICESALDGRMTVVRLGDGRWQLNCDGASPVESGDRQRINEIFGMALHAYRMGRTGAFSDLRKLIGGEE